MELMHRPYLSISVDEEMLYIGLMDIMYRHLFINFDEEEIYVIKFMLYRIL